MEDTTSIDASKAGDAARQAMAEALDDARSRMKRVLLIAAGTLFVALVWSVSFC